MTIVVTDNCKGCRFTECVSVCPVSCFHGDDEMLYIDNETCIDCSACIPVCPVEAIFDADDLPDDKRRWIAINAEKARLLPAIEDTQPALPGAEDRRAELGL